MWQRTPIYPDTKPRLRGSQLFFVDPSIGNEGGAAKPGSIPNYPYKLPFLAHNFPVRRIRLLNAQNLTTVPPLTAGGADIFLTLRKADGTYLLHDVPTFEFITPAGWGLPATGLIRDLFFDDDFFPDPRMSYVKWEAQGVTDRLAMEFHYG